MSCLKKSLEKYQKNGIFQQIQLYYIKAKCFWTNNLILYTYWNKLTLKIRDDHKFSIIQVKLPVSIKLSVPNFSIDGNKIKKNPILLLKPI